MKREKLKQSNKINYKKAPPPYETVLFYSDCARAWFVILQTMVSRLFWVIPVTFFMVMFFGSTVFAVSDAQAQVEVGAVEQHRAQLEQNLLQIEAEIAGQQKILSNKQQERVSLERDVAILDAKIREAKLSIQARNIVISQITANIQEKESVIFGLNEKLLKEKSSLAGLLRQADQLGGTHTVVAALSSDNLSAFFADLVFFNSISRALRESFEVIQDDKEATALQKQELEEKREEEVALRTVQELEQKKIQDKETERQGILKATKGQEAVYQTLIKEKQKTAAQIRGELFTLRGSAAIPFGKALEYATIASNKTGVRPAFILAIIAEESNLGENVGSGNWRIDMHPTRDRPVFAQLTARLGLNPDVMPVSKKPWYGWGGAMGPAQFIPSTWVMYEKRLAKATGHAAPSPWDPGDAIMAAALYSMDNGADKQTKTAEFRAAMCYLAGCGNANKTSLQFYGRDVAELADTYQDLIDVINGG